MKTDRLIFSCFPWHSITKRTDQCQKEISRHVAISSSESWKTRILIRGKYFFQTVPNGIKFGAQEPLFPFLIGLSRWKIIAEWSKVILLAIFFELPQAENSPLNPIKMSIMSKSFFRQRRRRFFSPEGKNVSDRFCSTIYVKVLSKIWFIVIRATRSKVFDFSGTSIYRCWRVGIPVGKENGGITYERNGVKVSNCSERNEGTMFAYIRTRT